MPTMFLAASCFLNLREPPFRALAPIMGQVEGTFVFHNGPTVLRAPSSAPLLLLLVETALCLSFSLFHLNYTDSEIIMSFTGR
jgi:hypothetical protein